MLVVAKCRQYSRAQDKEPHAVSTESQPPAQR